jgi:hypothetical protein
MPRKKIAAKTQAPVPVEEDTRSALAAATGSDHPEVQRVLLSNVIGALGGRPGTEAYAERGAAAFGLLAAFKARDAVEAMLASQAIALDSGGMVALRRATNPDLPPEVASRLRRDATAMFRASADLVQTIEGRRGNCGQKITVEHIDRAIFTGPQGGGPRD